MAFRMRSSKFRHVFGSPYKKEHCYECIQITKNAHDSNFCAVNPKFIAIVTESTGGGAFLVIPVDKIGRVDINSPKVCGHSGPVLDIKWSPFNDCVIASCSDDATIKVWQIPEDGLTSNLTDWQVDLHGHQRRVGFLEWHPTAENILLSAGYDFKCILWNTENAEPITIVSCHTDTIFSISWNRDGSLFATTSKDKFIRIINPRDGTVVSQCKGHMGPKASKVIFLGDTKKLFTTGFSRMSERQYAVWDTTKLKEPLKIESVDSSSGVLFPFYDADTNVVYLAGKGDGNIRYFEISDTAPYIHKLNQYQSASPQRGLGVMPKRGVVPAKCEIMRFYKLHTIKNLCEPISMIVPRKSEMFQEDLYPPTASICPSLTADEWLNGQDRAPILVSLKDGVTSSSKLSKTNTSRKSLRKPRILSTRSYGRKDGAIAAAPTITTYKAVRRGSGKSSTSPLANPVSTPQRRQASVSPIMATPQTNLATPSVHAPSKLPNSVLNINKLAAVDKSDEKSNCKETQENGDSSCKSENVNNRIAAFERKATTPNYKTSPTKPAPIDTRVDKKVWAQATQNGTKLHEPTTDPEHVHEVNESQSESDLFSADHTWNSMMYDETLDDIIDINDHTLSTTLTLSIDSEQQPKAGNVKRRSANFEQSLSPPISRDTHLSNGSEGDTPVVSRMNDSGSESIEATPAATAAATRAARIAALSTPMALVSPMDSPGFRKYVALRANNLPPSPSQHLPSLQDIRPAADELKLEDSPSRDSSASSDSSMLSQVISPLKSTGTTPEKPPHESNVQSPPNSNPASQLKYSVSPTKSPITSPNKYQSTPFDTPPVNGVHSDTACDNNTSTCTTNNIDLDENVINPSIISTPQSIVSSPFATPTIEPTSWLNNPLYANGKETGLNGDSESNDNVGITNKRTEMFEQHSKPPPITSGKVRITRKSSERIKNWQNRIDESAHQDAQQHTPQEHSGLPGAGSAVSVFENDSVNDNAQKLIEVNNNTEVSSLNGDSEHSDEVKSSHCTIELDEHYKMSAPDNTLIKPSKLRESLRKKRMERPTILDGGEDDSDGHREHKRHRFNRMKRSGRYQSDLGPVATFWQEMDKGNRGKGQLQRKELSSSTLLTSHSDVSVADGDGKRNKKEAKFENHNGNGVKLNSQRLEAIENPRQRSKSVDLLTLDTREINIKDSIESPEIRTPERHQPNTAVFSPYDNVNTEVLDELLKDLDLYEQEPAPVASNNKVSTATIGHLGHLVEEPIPNITRKVSTASIGQLGQLVEDDSHPITIRKVSTASIGRLDHLTDDSIQADSRKVSTASIGQLDHILVKQISHEELHADQEMPEAANPPVAKVEPCLSPSQPPPKSPTTPPTQPSINGESHNGVHSAIDCSPVVFNGVDELDNGDILELSDDSKAKVKVINNNYIPQTYEELRKAYFQQVEEISSLKEQISLKDYRIRQLEDELDQLRSNVCADTIGESIC